MPAIYLFERRTLLGGDDLHIPTVGTILFRILQCTLLILPLSLELIHDAQQQQQQQQQSYYMMEAETGSTSTNFIQSMIQYVLVDPSTRQQSSQHLGNFSMTTSEEINNNNYMYGSSRMYSFADDNVYDPCRNSHIFALLVALYLTASSVYALVSFTIEIMLLRWSSTGSPTECYPRNTHVEYWLEVRLFVLTVLLSLIVLTTGAPAIAYAKSFRACRRLLWQQEHPSSSSYYQDDDQSSSLLYYSFSNDDDISLSNNYAYEYYNSKTMYQTVLATDYSQKGDGWKSLLVGSRMWWVLYSVLLLSQFLEIAMAAAFLIPLLLFGEKRPVTSGVVSVSSMTSPPVPLTPFASLQRQQQQVPSQQPYQCTKMPPAQQDPTMVGTSSSPTCQGSPVSHHHQHSRQSLLESNTLYQQTYRRGSSSQYNHNHHHHHLEAEQLWINRCNALCRCLSFSTCFCFGGRDLISESATTTTMTAAATGGTVYYDHVARALADYLETGGVLDVVPTDLVIGLMVVQLMQRKSVLEQQLVVLQQQEEKRNQALQREEPQFFPQYDLRQTSSIVVHRSASSSSLSSYSIGAKCANDHSINNNHAIEGNSTFDDYKNTDDNNTEDTAAVTSSTTKRNRNLSYRRRCNSQQHFKYSTETMSVSPGIVQSNVNVISGVNNTVTPTTFVTESSGALVGDPEQPLLLQLPSSSSSSAAVALRLQQEAGGGFSSARTSNSDKSRSKLLDPQRDLEDAVLLQEGARFARYALSIYTWMLYLYISPVTGLFHLICCRPDCIMCRSYHRKQSSASNNDGNNGNHESYHQQHEDQERHDTMDHWMEICAGDNLCQWHKQSLLIMAGLQENTNDLVYAQFLNSLSLVPYCILLDHETKSVVLAVRGSLSLEDLVTDTRIDPEPFHPSDSAFFDCSDNPCASDGNGVDLDGQKHPHQQQYCHGGVLDTVRNLYHDLQRHGILQKLLLGDDAPYPDYRLRLVGHSLGAATCTLLSFWLRPQFPALKVYNYSVPGCTLTWDLATACQKWTTTFVLDADIVPRLSVNSMELLRDEILECIGQIKVPKYQVAQQMLLKHAMMSTSNSRTTNRTEGTVGTLDSSNSDSIASDASSSSWRKLLSCLWSFLCYGICCLACFACQCTGIGGRERRGCFCCCFSFGKNENGEMDEREDIEHELEEVGAILKKLLSNINNDGYPRQTSNHMQGNINMSSNGVSTYQRQLEHFQRIQLERKETRGTTRQIQLYPPGRIVHLVRKPGRSTRKGCIRCSGDGACSTTCLKSKSSISGRVGGTSSISDYTPVWVGNDELNKIVVSPSMGIDHFIDRICDVLECVAEEQEVVI